MDDNGVPSENGILTAMAYKEKGVPFEIHLFQSGVHGISLANKEVAAYPEIINVPVQAWFDLSVTWLNSRGFTIKNKGE